jgi:hypothetical protein
MCMLMRFVSSFAVLATVMVARTGNTLSACDAVYNSCRCSAACYTSSLLKPFCYAMG